MSKLESGLLATRRAAPLACQSQGGLTQVLLDLTLWDTLSVVLGKPLQRIVAYCVFTGRSILQLAVDVRRMLWRTVGWMSAPPRSPVLRDFGLRLARWQLCSGQ